MTSSTAPGNSGAKNAGEENTKPLDNYSFGNSLTDNEKLIRALLQFSKEVIILNDAAGVITYVSASVERMLGYREEELLGKSAFDFIHPDCLDDVKATFKWLQQPESTAKSELLFLHKNGSWRWVESSASNLLHVPEINAFVSNVTDITERKEISQQLQYSVTLTESIADAVVGTDLEYNITSWNKGAEKMYGWKAEEAVGKKAAVVFRRVYKSEEEQSQWREALNKNECWEGEVLHHRKDGTLFPVLVSIAFVKDKHGKKLGAVAVNRDVTERKKDEQVLKETKDQLELTFNNVPAGIFLFNNKGEILFANDIAAKIYGYHSVAEILAEKDVARLREKVNESFEFINEQGVPFSLEESATGIALKTGKARQVIYKTINKLSGKEKWTMSTAAPLFDAEGNLSRVLTANTDITLQKYAEEEIRLSEERFRTLAEALPQLIWTTDSKGVQEYTSRRWQQYTGLDPAAENVWLQILHPDDVKRVMEVWSDCLKTGQRYITEMRLKTKDNTYRWNYIQGEPLKNDKGEIVKWVGAFTDIHEQKTATEVLEQLVKHRTEELQRSNEDLQQYAHVASHDMQEPLRKISIFGNLLLKNHSSDLNEEGKTFLKKIILSTQRLADMTGSILEYSGISANQEKFEDIDLNDLIKQILTDFEVAIQQKNAVIHVGPLPVIQGARVLIYQLFYNLLNNSLKFAGKDRTPVVNISGKELSDHEVNTQPATATENKTFQITVEDNGIGFNQKDAENIFKTFSRLHSKNEYEGTGLGLSLCRKIVLRHHGNIHATSREGEGATFTILLPQNYS